jgi:hypothetical protein
MVHSCRQYLKCPPNQPVHDRYRRRGSVPVHGQHIAAIVFEGQAPRTLSQVEAALCEGRELFKVFWSFTGWKM